MNKIFLIFLIFLLFFISGCVELIPKAQSYTTIKGDKLIETYGKKPQIPPPSGYFVGISRELEEEQEARKEAYYDALRQILGYIGVEVSINQVEEIIESEGEEGILTSDVFGKTLIEVMGKAFLEIKPESEYVEKWERKTPYGLSYYYKAWSLVKFSKDEYVRKLNEIVNKGLELINYYLREADKLEKEKNIYLSMINYLSAISTLLNILEREKELKNLIPDSLNKLKIIANDIKGRILNINNRIEFIPLNPNISVIVRKRIEEPIRIKVIYKEDGKEYPINNFSLRFSFVKGRGDLEEVKVSNEDGIVTCKIFNISVGENIIEVKPADWDSNIISIPRARIYIKGISPSSLLKFAVVFKENILGKIRDSFNLENKFIEKLKEKNFNVISQRIKIDTEENMINTAKKLDVDILIFGIAEINNVNWIATSLYSTSCTVTIKVYSVKDKKIVATFNIPDENFKDTRGFGLTEESAIENALTLDRAKGFFDFVIEKIENILFEL